MIPAPRAAKAFLNGAWCLLLLLLVLLPHAPAQPSSWSLTVKSVDGQPLKECLVTPMFGSSDKAATQMTNGFGKARIATVPSEEIIVRCPGYRSQRLLRESPDEIETLVTLEKAVGAIRRCKRRERSYCLDPYQSFCIPKPQDYRVTCGTDIDYSTCVYCREVDGKDVCVSHGAGPLWSSGFPAAYLIDSSQDYVEEFHSLGRAWITDARGSNTKGSWRFIGKLGETITYTNVTSSAKKELDTLLDTICLYER